MAIERATAADAGTMARIHAAAFPPGEAWSRDIFLLQLVLPNVIGLIDRAGGLILLRHAAGEGEILTLATDAARRRHGIGRRLLHHATEVLRDSGVAALFLEVSVTNCAARALYAGTGFRSVGRRRQYYADGADALVMRLDLPPPATAA